MIMGAQKVVVTGGAGFIGSHIAEALLAKGFEIHVVDNYAGGTVAVLDAARRAGARRVVYAASSSAYGDQDALPLSENLPPQPKSPYGLPKYIGELSAKTWSDGYGLSTVSLRYFNVYGPRLD